MRSAPYVVPTGMLQGCSYSFLKFGWSRKRSSLSRTAIRKEKLDAVTALYC